MASIILELQSSYLHTKTLTFYTTWWRTFIYIWPTRKKGDTLNILITRGKMKLLQANKTNNRHHLKSDRVLSPTNNNFKFYIRCRRTLILNSAGGKEIRETFL